MPLLENEILKIEIKAAGAELCSIFHKAKKIEYMWQAGREWPKHAPVLFPIVGQLRDNKYHFKGKEYSLPRHGFARERNFAVVKQDDYSVTFRLKEDAATLKSYPFHFNFDIQYLLRKRELFITYNVLNTGNEVMYFSVGAHPAFRVPNDVRDPYDDYYLEFDSDEDSLIWPLKEGLIDQAPVRFLNSRKMPLSKALFEKDALVFKNIRSENIHLGSNRQGHVLSVRVSQCPFLGIWAAKGADFLCIEPWQGIADSVDATGNICEKEGIHPLPVSQNFRYEWGIKVW